MPHSTKINYMRIMHIPFSDTIYSDFQRKYHLLFQNVPVRKANITHHPVTNVKQA